MLWEFNSERPIYAQIIEQIELAVVTGIFVPGAKLPGVRELASEAGVNPNTMQRALAELETQGLLYTQRTSGRFVTEDVDKIKNLRQHLAHSLVEEFIQKMKALGCNEEEIAAYVQRAKEEL